MSETCKFLHEHTRQMFDVRQSMIHRGEKKQNSISKMLVLDGSRGPIGIRDRRVRVRCSRPMLSPSLIAFLHGICPARS